MVGAARGQPPASNDSQEVIVLLEYHKSASIGIRLRSSKFDPRVLSTEVLVDKDLRLASSTDDDTSVGSSNRTPDNGRRADGAGALVANQSILLGREDVERVGGETVENSAALRTAGLVNKDVLAVGKESDSWHTGTGVVVAISDVVDEGRPADEISGGLVRELLAVLGITLVSVVANELVLIDPGFKLAQIL